MDVKITETVPAAQMYAKIPEICKTFSIGATLARRLSDEMHASRKWKKYVIKMDHLTLVNIDGFDRYLQAKSY
jgi:hypothetical protein